MYKWGNVETPFNFRDGLRLHEYLYIYFMIIFIKNNLIHTYPLTKRGRLSTCHRSLKKMSKLHQQIFQLFFSNPQCSKKSAKKCNLKKSLHSKKFQTALILRYSWTFNHPYSHLYFSLTIFLLLDHFVTSYFLLFLITKTTWSKFFKSNYIYTTYVVRSGNYLCNLKQK